MSERRIGVYVCHCGGNISDYVDVERVVGTVQGAPGVVVAKHTMFACSDATQQEMAADIKEQKLDGLVVASCSPKLHTTTFRGVAKRAGLNPYTYNQVNIREQCSWAHTDNHEGATLKATGLVKAGIARSRLSVPLEPMVVQTTQKAMVVGAGIAGLRAAIGLADVGLQVFLVEREKKLGGWVGQFGAMYARNRKGTDLIAALVAEIQKRPAITVYTNAELVAKSGSFGNYVATVRLDETPAKELQVDVGSIVVATGFDTYQPEPGEFGFGTDGVVTLPEFKAMIDASPGPLTYRGKRVKTIAYIYCVGSRQPSGHEYCSRFCCAATAHASLRVAELGRAGARPPPEPGVHQYHLYRDIRTYGKFELMYTDSRESGAVYMKFADDAPPVVALGDDGKLKVTTRDTLTGGEELTIPADLVVLVTGMVPRKNNELMTLLKVPVGTDGFFNEIHPKLRPVETVVDGVLIAGACQGPKSASESVASGLAAVTQSAAILKKGFAELDPLVATVNASACTWCGKCVEVCPYSAIAKVAADGREVAEISASTCKGCGGCAPACPENAIDLKGYTDAQIRAAIDGMLEEKAA